MKKKTVTFKNILETSDDFNIVKKVYNPDKVPAVPIIKINKNYDALSRSERFARGDIVMPSRLTEVLKNFSVNHLNIDIDKLNSLTFKSVNNANRDTGAVNFGIKSTNSSSSGSTNETLLSTGEKKFILPKRSAHSCRVIKPNKRFLDDIGDESKQGHRKLNLKRGNKKTDDNSTDERGKKTENFINNTLSSQINSSKLDELDNDDSEASQTASDGHNTGIYIYIFNNNFLRLFIDYLILKFSR